MTQSADYVLGTHDAESARLALQHQVWRPYVLDAWMRAGMTRGSRVIDFGAGPGYATLDAADIVGPQGHVAALERSPAFVSHARRELERRAIRHVRLIECDLMQIPIQSLAASGEAPGAFDVAWCRWVASFVSKPQVLVEAVHASLRPGGRAVFHEYANYATWRAIPTTEPMERFVAEVMASWRASGGEPDIADRLLPALTGQGFRLVGLKPLIFAVRPTDFMWLWPASFVAANSRRLADLGRISPDRAEAFERDFRETSANPDAVMLTPLVLEVIAEKAG